MKKLLPQANSLDILIETFKYCVEHPVYSKNDLARYLGYQPRQVDYYLNACLYLDILDVKGKPTDYSRLLYNLGEQLRLGIYERILNDSLIGKIFTHYLIFPSAEIKRFAFSEVSSWYPDYKEAVIKRRVSTILSWCDEIMTFIKFS
jgi:hypothetical protein